MVFENPGYTDMSLQRGFCISPGYNDTPSLTPFSIKNALRILKIPLISIDGFNRANFFLNRGVIIARTYARFFEKKIERG